MRARRPPTDFNGAILAAAVCLSICSGCQSAALWHSTFAPADAPAPVAEVPESRFWGASSVQPSNPSPVSAVLNSGAAQTVSFDSGLEAVAPLSDGSENQALAAEGPTGNGSLPSLPGSVAQNFASTLDRSDEPMTRGEHFLADVHDMWPEIKQDYKNYYSWHNAALLAVGFGVAAPLANTDVDQKIRDWYQTDVRSNTSNQIAKVAKGFGTGGYVIPGVVAGWLAGEMFYDTTAGNWLDQWGNRTIRAGLVGAPPMLFAQYLTGGSRPDFPNAHSDWRPFSGDSNGVSGHSFVCGLVFIDAAKMTDDIPMKMGFYALSTMAGWSRVNDDAHYTSQVILGWWMAYCAASAVDLTNQQQSKWSIMPMPMENGAGMELMYQY